MGDDLMRLLRETSWGNNAADTLTKWDNARYEAADRIEALEAENERLRGALIEIRDCTGEHGGAAKALKLISAALGDTE